MFMVNIENNFTNSLDNMQVRGCQHLFSNLWRCGGYNTFNKTRIFFDIFHVDDDDETTAAACLYHFLGA
jgi:hypothetical protein